MTKVTDLVSLFRQFCPGAGFDGMDSRSFEHLCRRCSFFDNKFGPKDAGLIFAKVVARGNRMELLDFEDALELVGRRKNLDLEGVLLILRAIAEDERQAAAAVAPEEVPAPRRGESRGARSEAPLPSVAPPTAPLAVSGALVAAERRKPLRLPPRITSFLACSGRRATSHERYPSAERRRASEPGAGAAGGAGGGAAAIPLSARRELPRRAVTYPLVGDVETDRAAQRRALPRRGASFAMGGA